MSVVMVIGMLPLSMIPASAADYTVDTLEIKLDGAAVGNVITKDSVTVTTEHCFINEQTLSDYFKCLQVNWYDLTDQREIAVGKDKYERGHTYRLQVPVASDAERGTSKPSRAQYWFKTVENGKRQNIYGNYYTIYRADVDVTVNGDPATCEHDDSYDNNNKYCRRVAVSYTFTLVEDVSGVRVSLDDPYAGNKPDNAPVIRESDAGKYDLYAPSDVSGYDDGVEWWDNTAKRPVGNDTEFIEGHSYSATVCLKANDGYRFTGIGAIKLPIAYIGVYGCDVQRYAGSDEGDIIFITHDYGVCTKPLVKTVTITGLDAPLPDCSPDFNVGFGGDEGYEPGTTSYRFKDGVSWADKADGTQLKETDVFEEGHEYICYLMLKAKDGYSFATTSDGTVSTVAVTVNGVNKSPQEYGGYELTDRLLITLDMGVCEYKIITEVGINDLELTPRPGRRPDYEATVAGSVYSYNYAYRIWTEDNTQFTKNGISWSDHTLNGERLDAETATFTEKHFYRVNVYIKPQPGYKFAVDAEGNAAFTGTINGEPMGVGKYKTNDEYKDVGYVYCYTEQCLTEEISGVSVSGIEEPVAGYSPSFAAVSDEADKYEIFTGFATENANTYAHNGVSWYDRDAGRYLDPDDTFISGHRYTCEVYLLPSAGYVFPEAVNDSGRIEIKGKMNGRDADRISNNIGRLEQTGGIAIAYTFAKDETPVLYSFSLDDIVYPVEGEKPVYDGTPGKFTKLCTDYHSKDMLGYFNGIMWYDITDKRRLDQNDTFIKGHKYSVKAVLEATDGCEFNFTSEDTTRLDGTVNGISAYGWPITTLPEERRLYLDASATIGVCKEKPAVAPKIVSRIDIVNVTEPVAGETPEFYAEVDTEGLRVASDYSDENYHYGVAWLDMTEYHYMTGFETFLEGHTYQLYVIVKTEDGYQFYQSGSSNSGIYTYVNGKQQSSMHFGDNDTKYTRLVYADIKCKAALAEHSVTVAGGTAELDGDIVTKAKFSDVITIKCTDANFERWTCDDEGVDITNVFAPETTLLMPDNDITVTAVLKASDPSHIHKVTVVGGAALDKDNNEITSAQFGQSVYITWYAPQNRTFDHWETDTNTVDIDDIHSVSTKFIMPDRDITITAVENENEPITMYSISVTNGVATDPYFQQITSAAEGDTVRVMWASSPGYDFNYWQSEGTPVVFDDPASMVAIFTMPAGNVSVTAVQSEVITSGETCTVTYDANDGTLAKANVTVKKDSELTLPECMFTPPAGKEFAGWSAGKPGEKLQITADTIIYAAWQDVTEKIIEYASCTVTTPKAGAHPDMTAVSDDPAKYDTTVLYWYLDDGSTYPHLTASDTFEESKTYRVRVRFDFKTGYKVTDDTAYYINTQEASHVGTNTWETRFKVDSSAITGIFGDVDRDGTITAGDALKILRQSAGMENFDSELIYIGDIDEDGSITAGDALAVLRYSAGFEDGNKVGKPIT